MYGLIALGFHVTYVVSNTVNFSQGSSMMLGAVLGYTFAIKLGWPIAARGGACRCCSARCSVSWSSAPGAAVRRARLEWLADGDGCGRHRARQHRAVHLRQGAARAFRRSSRRSRSSCSAPACFRCNSSFPLVGLGITIALHFAFHRTQSRQGAACGGAEQGCRAADGHQRAGCDRVLVRAVDCARGSCRSADRAAVQRAFRHGHAVRHQGLRGRDSWRHHVGVRRDAGRLALWADRGAGHRATPARPTRRSSPSPSSSSHSP